MLPKCLGVDRKPYFSTDQEWGGERMELPGLRWGAHGRECLTWGTSFLGRAEVLLDLLLLLKSEEVKKTPNFQSDGATRKIWMFPCSNTTNRTLNLQDELQDLRKPLSPTKGAGRGLKMAHEGSFWESSGLEDGWGGRRGCISWLSSGNQNHPPVSLSQDLLEVTPWASVTALKPPQGLRSQTKQPQQ